MIKAAVNLLVSQLNEYVRVPTSGDAVMPGNISFLESDGGALDSDKIVVSLVNIEEEGALKNGYNVRTIGASTHYENRPVFLNLYLLYSAHFNDYPTALDALAQVIEYFQANKVFNFHRTPPVSGFPPDSQTQELQIVLELHTLTFQEINDLWGSLGGKQVPFVMYKARLLPIRARVPLAEATPVRRIDLDSGHTG